MEEWRKVSGVPGYLVSSLGKVQGPRKLLKPTTANAGGYQIVRLGRDGGYHTVHKLVLTAFVGSRPEGMEACHNDGNPVNNRVENLRWDTRPANRADTKRHGNQFLPHGELNGFHVLTDDAVRDILESSEAVNTLAVRYGVHRNTIGRVRSGKTWPHMRS